MLCMNAQKSAISALALAEVDFLPLRQLNRNSKKKSRKTQTQQPTTKMSRAASYQSGVVIYLSAGRAAAPSNHGAPTPHSHKVAVSCRDCARCCWLAHFGGFGHLNRNREEGGALALGGRQSMAKHNNHPNEGVDIRRGDGEETWTGGTREGWHLIVGQLPDYMT